jgi:hypothetical protein
VRANRIPFFSIPIVLLFMLVACLAGVRTGLAQAEPVNLIVSVLPGPDAAGAALSDMDALLRTAPRQHAPNRIPWGTTFSSNTSALRAAAPQ